MSTHEALPQFCQLVKNLKNGNAEKALTILWFHDRSQPDIAMSSGQLTKYWMTTTSDGRTAPSLRRGFVRAVSHRNQKKQIFPEARVTHHYSQVVAATNRRNPS